MGIKTRAQVGGTIMALLEGVRSASRQEVAGQEVISLVLSPTEYDELLALLERRRAAFEVLDARLAERTLPEPTLEEIQAVVDEVRAERAGRH
ncbi:MAG TPA: hypothetical protein EYH32_11045 [Anaerolineae bacterium]|nr:hypothetical protein [Anaerolineae bacterium]